jgi:DNA polymerase I
MQPITLPNIRKIFVPDPGYTIFDCDLSGADALVVAAESGDRGLISAIRSGYDLHTENATEIFGEQFTKAPPSERAAIRQQCKSAVHGTNYGASAFTLARTFGWPVARTERFQQNWFRKHPGVREWHRRVERQLAESRTIRNAFGYRIIYFDRVESCFTNALAWIPQSTVAECCFRGALQLEARVERVEMLLQVHDSIVFQIPTKDIRESLLRGLTKHLEVPIPYKEPLIIPWKISKSEKSWGDCEPCVF